MGKAAGYDWAMAGKKGKGQSCRTQQMDRKLQCGVGQHGGGFQRQAEQLDGLKRGLAQTGKTSGKTSG